MDESSQTHPSSVHHDATQDLSWTIKLSSGPGRWSEVDLGTGVGQRSEKMLAAGRGQSIGARVAACALCRGKQPTTGAVRRSRLNQSQRRDTVHNTWMRKYSEISF